MGDGPSVSYPVSRFGVARNVIGVPNDTRNDGRMAGIAPHTQMVMTNPIRDPGPSVMEVVPLGCNDSWQQLLWAQEMNVSGQHM